MLNRSILVCTTPLSSPWLLWLIQLHMNIMCIKLVVKCTITETSRTFTEVTVRTILIAFTLHKKTKLFKPHNNKTLASGRYQEGHS